VLFVDLDDLKTVNDSLGHAAGDELLVAVAERLRRSLRETDLACRLGGDEFGILLTDVTDRRYAEAVSSRLLEALDAPIDLAGRPLTVRASIGIALDTAGMGHVDELLADADTAMYQAKALGKGRYQVFAPAGVAMSGATSGASGTTATTEAGPTDARPRSWPERQPHVRRPTVDCTRPAPEAG
jgi:diguanylate cyclase (GGDEF)-like protein